MISQRATRIEPGYGAELRDCRMLVVGGAGFVGSNLVRHALSLGCSSVVIVDNLLSSEEDNVPGDARVSLLKGPAGDSRVLAMIRDDFDYVFHLATFHGNQNSIADPLADHEHNVFTTLRLYEHLKGFRRIRKVVYAASGCTLAPHTFEQAEPVLEDGPVPLELDSPYQISKVVGEFYSVYYCRQHGLPTVRARFQNVYGPGEILGAGQWRGTAATVWRNVTPTFVYRAIKRLPLQVENEGRASRDFIYVDDVVRGLVACALKGTAGGVYNLASGVETAILELATTINRMTDNPIPIEYMPRRAWDHAGKRVGSTVKALNELGFSASVSLEQGLEATIRWTKDNLPLIERCIARHAGRMAA
ncbi:MAG TPA: NAD-dependent epimerase/dehydratase family protein [Nitrospiraceae bacterium]|nr:NAD-dependent epimerase/dehydratase family protein [Nitrospiraceae bacterium]